MKRHVALLLLLILCFAPLRLSKVTTQNVICGKYIYSWQPCQTWYIFQTCDGQLLPIYSEIPPPMDQYYRITNPRWEDYAYECEGEIRWIRLIMDMDAIEPISSCSDCLEPSPSCEEWLHIKCNVGGYELYIDGDYVLTEDGDGECGVALPPGTYTVKLKKEGCDTVTETARIECGHETTLRVTMDCEEEEEEGNIKIYVEDENGYDIGDAKIYLDGDYQGKTDSSGILKIYDVPEGLHTVEAGKSGYRSDSETIRVIAGEWTEVHLKLIKDKPEEHDIMIVVRNNWDAFTSTAQYLRELVICCSTSLSPDEISITIDVIIPDDAHVDKVVLKTSEPLKQGCGDLQKPDEDTFTLHKVGSGLYRNERIYSCDTPFIEVMEYIIDKLCGGCLGVNHMKPEINGEVWVYFNDTTQPLRKKLKEPLPTIYDAYDSLVDKIRSNDMQIFIGGSSIDLTVVDSSGRKIGASYSESGVFLGEANEITDGIYSGRDVSPEIIVVPQCGQYKVYVNGTGTGDYSLKVVAVKNNETYLKTISSYITEGKTHVYTVTSSSEGIEIHEEESDNGSHDDGACSGTILLVVMLAAGIVTGYIRWS